MRKWLRFLLLCHLFIALSAISTSVAGAQTEPAPTSEEDRERVAAERFLSLLERQPRFGTALDKVYAYYTERGTLDELLATKQSSTTNPDQAGAAWMVIGLIEFQRGRDNQAVQAFREAERLRPSDALASYYLGRALLLAANFDEAAQAHERALERRPQRADALEIFQQLGRLYQRAHKTEEALKVWVRFEQAFPDDLRVQEQIAGILADEGDQANALTRFEKLAVQVSDPYRKVQHRLKAAELKLQLGQSDVALKDLEQLLGQLKPDSWLHRDVRGRIEAHFLRTDDFDGLTTYYETWLGKNPDDLDAMGRLGRVLGLQQRWQEAEEWSRKALMAAPSNITLRRTLIDQLLQANQVQEALLEYAELDRIQPNHPDTIRAWGQAVLDDKSQPEMQRKQQAAAIWKKLLATNPNDPVIVSQVADLLRQVRLTDESIQLHKQAIALAPHELQYREYLGEYLHVLGRGPEALAVWKEIAAGEQRTSKTLIRLAEVYRGFGYREESLATMAEACRLDPEFGDFIRYAQLLRDTADYDAALEQLARAERLAENDDERQQILGDRIKVLSDANRLKTEIDLLDRIPAGKRTAEQWRTLALYYEAAHEPRESCHAISKSLALDDQSKAAWAVAARVNEATGLISQAVEAYQRLAALDRRARTDYLQQIASLSLRLGNIDAALQTGRDVIAAAPGNPEHYQFYANLCFQLGRIDEGLEALRRAVRVNPNDEQALLTLAAALADQYRTDEAIELYWRAFGAAKNLEGQNGVVAHLSELYLRNNRFEQLIARLSHLAQDRQQARDAVFWLATAYQSAGDLGSARDALAKLLSEDSKDTHLLMQLVRLSEADGDLGQAIAHLRSVLAVSTSREGRLQLAKLLLRSGESEEAETIWLDLAQSQQESHKAYETIDDLILHGRYSTALQLADERIRSNPRDWEALYRAGLALWRSNQKAQAMERLEQLRALPLPHDQPSAKAEFRLAQAQRKSTGATIGPPTTGNPIQNRYPPAMQLTSTCLQIQQVFFADTFGKTARGYQWTPDDFGQARLAAPAVKFSEIAVTGNVKTAIDELERRLQQPTLSSNELWDIYGLSGLAQRYVKPDQRAAQQLLFTKVTRKLSELDDPGGKLVYLSNLRSQQPMTIVSGVVTTSPGQKLPAAELDHALACYDAVRQAHPEWVKQFGLPAVLALSLKSANRRDDMEAVFQQVIEQVSDQASLMSAIFLANQLNKTNDLMDLVDRLQQNIPQSTPSTGLGVSAFHVWLQVASVFGSRQDYVQMREALGRALVARGAELTEQPLRLRTAPKSQKTGMVPVFTSSGQMAFVSSSAVGSGPVADGSPSPNAYFDQSALTQLQTLYVTRSTSLGGTVQVQTTSSAARIPPAELNKLVDFLENQAADTSGETQVLYQLAAAYFRWWSGDVAAANVSLQRAVEWAPDNAALRLQLAELHLKRSQFAEALAAADAVEPMDVYLLRNREQLALQAALKLKALDRARQAAERLAGMPLDGPAQLQLADQMQQLGMQEQSDQILDRLRLRSGSDVVTLAQLMQKYQARGKMAFAVQVAQQILRRSPPAANQPSTRTRLEATARQQALQLLKTTDELPKIIARLEAQLARSPNSSALRKQIAEYRGGGAPAAATTTRIVRPTIPPPVTNTAAPAAIPAPAPQRTAYSMAAQLARSGDLKAACEKYAEAIENDPHGLSGQFSEVQNVFRQTLRLKAFVEVFLKVDLAPFRGHTQRLADLANEATQSSNARSAGLALLRRLADAFPEQRTQLLTAIRNEELWQTDALYPFVRESLLPQPGQRVLAWQGFSDVLGYRADGRAVSLPSRFLQMIKASERREQASREVRAALKEAPAWQGGMALLALLEAQAGDITAATQRIDKLLSDAAVPSRAAHLLAQELSDYPALSRHSIQLFEIAARNESTNSTDYHVHPGRQLARLYAQTGQRSSARSLIHELLDKQDYSRNSALVPGYREARELQALHAATEDLLKLEMPWEAIPLCQRALSDSKRLATASRWIGHDARSVWLQTQTTAEQAIATQPLSTALADWIHRPKGTSDQTPAIQSSPTVQFALSVHPRSTKVAAIVSLFETALETAAGKPLTGPSAVESESPRTLTLQELIDAHSAHDPPVSALALDGVRQSDVFAKVREQLAAAAADRDDLHVRIAVALVELTDPRPNQPAATVAAVQRVVEAATSMTDRPSSDALIAAWLVARRALRYPSLEVRDLGEILADSSTASARTQNDRQWLIAILRERGQLEREFGNLQAAERFWTELLSTTQEKPAAAKSENRRQSESMTSAPVVAP